MDGIVLQFKDRQFLNINLHNVEQKFKEEILPALRA